MAVRARGVSADPPSTARSGRGCAGRSTHHYIRARRMIKTADQRSVRATRPRALNYIVPSGQ
eukprot:4926836-Prymnesium_polylepis.1